MKISDLKQPYRRIAEYLGDENNTISHSLSNYFFRFYNKMHKGENPEITEEIKEHFPPDFDFSEEEVKNKPVIQMLDAETQKTIYTQLAKEGKFDELPDTCEFSEPVELEVWDDDGDYLDKIEISGKYKGYYIDCTSTGLYSAYQHAQLPTKKIDFTQFQTGDVVEVELVHNETKLGWFDFTNENHLYIRIVKRQGNQTCNGGSCAGTKIINKEKIKSITKIK